MGAHTDSLVSRLEVVEVGRRRRWSDAEKLRIVAESMAGRRLVSATARRHGISRSQLYTWRRLAILWHDGVGMSLYARRLEKGRFIWPTPKNGSVAISAAQLAYMLDGIDWRNPRQTWRPQTAG
jgi:hypothetical protein